MSDATTEAYWAGVEDKTRLADARANRKGLHFDCVRCRMPIERPGGLLISPPDGDGFCRKSHVCADCWPAVAAAAGVR